jgi:hypothetical protein
VKELADQNGLFRNLRAYLAPKIGGRAILLAGKETDRLLVKKGANAEFRNSKDFYDWFTVLSQYFLGASCDREWGELLQINPHAIRSIAFTAISRYEHSDECASDALLITLRTGQKHYKWNPPEERTRAVSEMQARYRRERQP